MKSRFNRFSYFVLICLLVSTTAIAQNDSAVINVKAGLWSDPSVWITNTIPTPYDSVILMYDLQVDVNAFCKSLKLNGHNVIVAPNKVLTIAGYKPEIRDNVFYIDPAKFTLTSTPSQLTSGIYNFTFSGDAPNIKATDVIYGITGNGYIRKVKAVTISANTITLSSSQGNMTDLFGNASFNFSIPPGGMTKAGRINAANKNAAITSANADTFTVNGKNLLTLGPVTVKMDTAVLIFNPNFNFKFDFTRQGLQAFEMACKQATLNAELKLTIAAQGAINTDKVDTLYKASKTKVVLLGEIPVVIVMDFYFISKLEFSTEAAIQKSITLNANSLFDLGVAYANGQWQGLANYTPAGTYTISETQGKVKAKIALSLKPQFNVRFYNLAGPYVFFGINNSLEGAYSTPSLNWDFLFATALEAGVGAEYNFYKDSTNASAGNFGPKTWSVDLYKYQTPFSIKKISGDQQTFVDTSHYIPDALKVQVLDALGKPQRNVMVTFKVNKGGGYVRDSIVISDTAGYAQTFWKYGVSGSKQEVQVLVFKGDSTPIGENPTYFRSGKDSLVLNIYNMANTPSFTTNAFKSIKVGKAGFVWAGTQNQGLYTLLRNGWIKQSTILTNHNINQIQLDKDSAIWLAFTGSTTSIGGGVGCIRDSVVTSSSYTYYGAITTDAPNRNARSIFIDTSRYNGVTGLANVWTAHMGNTQAAGDPSGSVGKGLLAASPFIKRITTGVQTIAAGGTGSCQIVGGDSAEVWVFANSNFGRSQLLRYDTKTANPLGWYDYTNVSTSILRKAFFAKAIYFDVKGRNWVGLDTGIAVKEGSKWVRVIQPFTQFLPANTFVNTHAIAGDSQGNVYIGTNNGFLMYIGGPLNDRSSYDYYTMADSLPSNNILGITVDEKGGRVVFATDAGIAIWKR